MDFLEYFKIMFFTTSLVTGSFALTQKVVKNEYSRNIGVRIKKFDLAEWFRKWPQEFTSLFDSIFGTDHFTWKCFLRSCLVSLLCLIILFFSYFWLRKSDSISLFIKELKIRMLVKGAIWRNILISIYLLILLLPVQLIPDYLSLLETRFVIGKIGTNSGGLRTLGFLVFDFLATDAIFFITGFLLHGIGAFLFTVFNREPEVFYKFIWGIYDFICKLHTSLPNSGMSSPTDRLIFLSFYTTFFTSVWVWCFSITTITTKFFEKFKDQIQFIPKFLDIEKKPFLVLGWISGTLLIIGFTIAMPFFVNNIFIKVLSIIISIILISIVLKLLKGNKND